MDITTAGVFFVSIILYGFGIIVMAAVILLINNMFSRFWKPVEILKFTDYPPENKDKKSQ